MRNFKKIRAWQLADDLAVAVYEATAGFPRNEQFGLTAQMRRCAVSVASNIAEGSKRRHNPDYLRFLDIANGSVAELEYQVHLAHRLKYLSEERYTNLAAKVEEVARTLYGLIVYVEGETHSRNQTS